MEIFNIEAFEQKKSLTSLSLILGYRVHTQLSPRNSFYPICMQLIKYQKKSPASLRGFQGVSLKKREVQKVLNPFKNT